MDRILIKVENKRDYRLLQEWLSRSYEVTPVDPEKPLREEFDLAIIDGPNLKHARSTVRDRRRVEEPVLLPFLLVTVHRKGTTPARHLGRLVDDLIVRPLDEAEVKARVANLLRMRHLSLQLKKEHDRVVKLSVTDDVSGFHNTRYLHRYLDRLLAASATTPSEVSLVFIDLDNFKHIVDAHGHLLGARVLKEVAQTIDRVLDDDDRLVRYGGDEYVVLLPRQNKAQALAKVRRMKEAVAATRFLQKEHLDVRLTASFGLANFPHDAKDKRELLAEADRCLFQSKSEGKNRLTFGGMPEADLLPA